MLMIFHRNPWVDLFYGQMISGSFDAVGSVGCFHSHEAINKNGWFMSWTGWWFGTFLYIFYVPIYWVSNHPN